jgi:hypothetical protein
MAHLLDPEMLASVTKVPIAVLDQAIKARDPGRFATAYEQLTEACNICSADRGIIIIQPPQASPFPNQDFRPAKE